LNRFYFFTPVLGGPGAPRYPISSERQVIGRSEDTAMALLEPTVSRRHATVFLEDDTVWLEDLDSKHGTFVNSKRVSRTSLKEGDIVVFGLSIVLRLEMAEREVPPAKPLRVPGLMAGPLGPVSTAEVDISQHTRALSSSERQTAVQWPAQSPLAKEESKPGRPDQMATTHEMSESEHLSLSLLPDIYQNLSRLRDKLLAGASKQDEALDNHDMANALEPILSTLSTILKGK